MLPRMTWPPYSTLRYTPRDATKRDQRPFSGTSNLVCLTGPVRAADELAAWTEARQQMKVTDVRVTEMQVARWQYTTAGMMPVVLASASLL